MRGVRYMDARGGTYMRHAEFWRFQVLRIKFASCACGEEELHAGCGEHESGGGNMHWREGK